MNHAEVLMSERTAMSITVSVEPHASGGLTALAAEHLADAVRKKRRPSISNKLTGPVRGTVVQIGNVYNMNEQDGR